MKMKERAVERTGMSKRAEASDTAQVGWIVEKHSTAVSLVLSSDSHSSPGSPTLSVTWGMETLRMRANDSKVLRGWKGQFCEGGVL